MMHRNLKSGVVVAMLAVLCSGQNVQAGPPNNAPGDSSISTQDLLYDFQVWIAWDVVEYKVVARFSDGHVEQFTFGSEENAEDFIAWLAFHVLEFAGAEIVEQVTMSPWTYLATYDKKSQANAVAAYAIALGYYAKVVPESSFMIRLSP